MKFLRRLRLTALKRRKTLSYICYAIGEIALVVIGILIAVHINRQREEASNRALELNFARELKSSFLKSKERMTYIHNWSEKIYISQEKVMAYLNDPKQKPLPTKKDWSMFFKTNLPTLPNAAYESLKAFGLNLIRNDNLRAQLINLYDTTYPAFKEATSHYNNQLTDILRDSGPYLSDWSWSWSDFPTEVQQLETLKADDSYTFKLKLLKEMNLYNITELKEIIKTMDEIILGLDQELQTVDTAPTPSIF